MQKKSQQRDRILAYAVLQAKLPRAELIGGVVIDFKGVAQTRHSEVVEFVEAPGSPEQLGKLDAKPVDVHWIKVQHHHGIGSERFHQWLTREIERVILILDVSSKAELGYLDRAERVGKVPFIALQTIRRIASIPEGMSLARYIAEGIHLPPEAKKKRYAGDAALLEAKVRAYAALKAFRDTGALHHFDE